MDDEKRRAIETLRERIKTDDALTEADREALLAFSDEMFLLKTRYGDPRHEKLLRHCAIMAGSSTYYSDDDLPDVELSAALESRDATEDLVRWINRTHTNEETNRDYRTALRVFADRVTDEEGIPETVSWVPTGTSRNYKPKPKPGNMLRWEEDVLPMIKATKNSRDAALIATAWDSGARSGEIRALQVGDVTDHMHGLQITVDGKTGQRTVMLIPSVPYLQRWLSDHPGDGDPDVPLWSQLNDPEDVSYNALRKTLVRAADEAGVMKPVTFTNFRKSSASHLASQNINQAILEDHHGWVRGSDVASRYVSVFGGDTDRELARVHGLDVEVDEPDPLAPLQCPRCGRETPREDEFCVWCGQAVEPGAIDSIRQQQRDARDAVLNLAREDLELLSKIDRLQDVLAIAQENPGFLDDAEEFVDALQE